MRKVLAGGLILFAALTAVFSGSAAFAESESSGEAEKVILDEEEAIEYLGKELEASAAHLLKDGEDVDDIYSALNWRSVADTLPASFDLRDRGTVTPVKSQSPWGTCWSFATTAASETSILNSLGMTADAFKERFGKEMDLSERHLAWFTAKPLPELSEYPDGEYPYEEAQSGEGLYFLEGTTTEPLNAGGNYFLSATSLSDGIGILFEQYAPYMNNEGTRYNDGDWSLPEEMRYSYSYELRDANILPAPTVWDDEDNFTYRPGATEAIKTELLAGRAVGISFFADNSMPKLSPEETRRNMEKDLADVRSLTEEEKARYIDVRAGITDTKDLSLQELQDLILLRMKMNDMPEDTYDLDSFDHDQLSEIVMSRYFGKSFEEIDKLEHAKPYMSFIGTDPVIYAQYTFEKKKSNHAVTVVGWDDSFAADNWPEDRRPPADGAWIVKNSWDTDWGNEGYFMLSYYDKSLSAIGSFEYITNYNHLKMNYVDIKEYDNMPAELISSTLFDTPVYAANVFSVDSTCVLEYISAMTGDLNTAVNASVYLLDQDAESPTDGLLLETVTGTFQFAGYHRMALDNNLLLPEGSRISVVFLENVPVGEDSKYALVNTSSLNEEGVKAYNALHEDPSLTIHRYAKGIVNPGESFVSFEYGKWADWSEVIGTFRLRGDNARMSYDNLPVKAYLYSWQDVEQAHDLTNRMPAAGGEVAVCPRDGFSLLDVSGLAQ